MKQKIKLTETQLQRFIKESVRKVLKEELNKNKILKEAGHLYWKDEDGVAHTNSKKTYRGVPGTVFIYNGEWSDPEVLYKGHELNYYDIEDSLWIFYEDDCFKNEVEATENGFEQWLSEMGNDYIKTLLDELILQD